MSFHRLTRQDSSSFETGCTPSFSISYKTLAPPFEDWSLVTSARCKVDSSVGCTSCSRVLPLVGAEWLLLLPFSLSEAAAGKGAMAASVSGALPTSMQGRFSW